MFDGIGSLGIDTPDFSVVLFRPNFMLTSVEHLMKAHKNQGLLTTPSPPVIPCEPRTKAHTMVSGGQTPSPWPERGQSPEMWAYNCLRTKHFHVAPSARPHAYSLKSQYGKVRRMLSELSDLIISQRCPRFVIM